MITQEEEDRIIEKAIERALLLIPEVIGNMMAQQSSLNDLNSKFYKDYPEFKDKKDVVASVIEMVEGKNPLKKYEDILKEAVPEIRERILTMKNMNMSSIPEKPERNLKDLDIPSITDSDNGEL